MSSQLDIFFSIESTLPTNKTVPKVNSVQGKLKAKYNFFLLNTVPWYHCGQTGTLVLKHGSPTVESLYEFNGLY